jgi:acyl-CoA-binding protein
VNHLTDKDKLWLYALFKQATVGDAPGSFAAMAGSSWNLVASQAKYFAWRKLHGMPREAAYYQYIAITQIYLEECEGTNDEFDESATTEHAENRTKTTETTNGSESSSMDDFLDKDHEATNDPSYQSSVSGAAQKRGGMGSGSGSLGIAVSQPLDSFEPTFVDANDCKASREYKYLRAAANDDVETIRDLIHKEPSLNLNFKDDMGQTALHMAADNGSLSVLRYLLTDYDMDVNAADDNGISVLQAAVIAGQIDVCRFLLEHGANPDQEDEDGDTPRHCAVDDGSEELLGLFV